MSDQNKNTGTAPGGTTSKPAHADNKGASPSTEQRGQAPAKTPNHEQGREHAPNVNAQNEAADARRTTEQAHVPSATSNAADKSNGNTNDRKDNVSGDDKRTTADGQHDSKKENEPAKIVAGDDTSGKR